MKGRGRVGRVFLAGALERLGDLPAARRIAREARASPAPGVDPSRGVLCQIYATEASIELAAGRLPEAREAAEEAIGVARSALETECAFVGTALARDVEPLVKAGVAARLEPLLVRGAERERRLLGESGSWAEMWMAIAVTRIEVRPGEALRMLEEALSIMERPDVRATLHSTRCLRAMGLVLDRMGDRTAARNRLKRALDQARAIHGETHTITRDLRAELGARLEERAWGAAPAPMIRRCAGSPGR
jgi:tetratricopeptide (TPR) repeat protein